MNHMATLVLLAGLVAAAGGVFARDARVLTTTQGMTLYTFDKDIPGKSNCIRGCDIVWPPAAVADVAPGADIGAITREDGSKQATFKGKPLYLFAADLRPGDRGGEGVGNVWHTVPSKRRATPAASSARTGPGSRGGYGSGY